MNVIISSPSFNLVLVDFSPIVYCGCVLIVDLCK